MTEVFREVTEAFEEHDNEEFANLLKENFARTGMRWIEDMILPLPPLTALNPNKTLKICATHKYHDDGILEIRDASNETVLAQDTTPGGILHVVFPEPKLAMAAYRITNNSLGIMLWNGGTTFKKFTVERPQIPDNFLISNIVRLSPSGQHLLVTFGTRMHENISLSSLEPTHFFLLELGSEKAWMNPLFINTTELPKPFSRNLRAEFSPNGCQLAIFPVDLFKTPEECPGTLINIQDATQRNLITDGKTRGIAWSPCSRWIATYQEPATYEGSIRIYDINTCEIVGQISGLRDPAVDSSLADSVYFATADHDTSSILQWSQDGTRLVVSGYGRTRMLRHNTTLETKRNILSNRGMAGFSEPSLELPSTNGKYTCLLWGDGSSLIWDLTTSEISYMGLLPTERPEIIAHDNLLIFGGKKSTWLLCVSLGRVIYLNELIKKASIVGDCTSISKSIALRPGGTDILFTFNNTLLLVNIVTENLIWQRKIEVPVQKLIWNKSGTAYYIISSDYVIIKAESDGIELDRWKRWIGSRFSLTKENDGIVMIGREWGRNYDHYWELFVGQQQHEILDDSYQPIAQQDFRDIFPYWRNRN